MNAFSVVICTRDRAELVAAAIESVLAQRYDRALFELIVIANDATPATLAAIERSLDAAPIAAVCHREPRPGVSFARNLGASCARHAYVAFLDDDATADPDWLLAYDAAIADHGAVAVGGRVEPVVEREPPAWWQSAEVRGFYALDHGAVVDRLPVARIRWPLWLGGGNSVYARRLLDEVGGFRTDLGPTGGRRRVAEDIDLNIRLERAGVPIHYAHDAVIRHLVPAQRLTRGYLLRRAYWAGRTEAAARVLLDGRAKRGSLRGLARAALRLPFTAEPERTLSSFRLAYAAGYWAESVGRESAP